MKKVYVLCFCLFFLFFAGCNKAEANNKVTQKELDVIKTEYARLVDENNSFQHQAEMINSKDVEIKDKCIAFAEKIKALGEDLKNTENLNDIDFCNEVMQKTNNLFRELNSLKKLFDTNNNTLPPLIWGQP